MLESGQGYWQLAVREEKGIRNRSNSLSSLISEAVSVSATFFLLLNRFTVEGRDLLNGGSERPAELRAAKVRKWNTCFLPRQFFFFFSHQISGHARKRASDRSRGKYRGEEMATASCVLRA